MDEKHLFIFDKDGTLVHNPIGGFCNNPDQQVVLPGVRDKLMSLRQAGYSLAIASNQGGVAHGYITYSMAVRLMADASRKVGGVHLWEFCPHEPKGTWSEFAVECECRKPMPGLLTRLMARLECRPEDTVFVGDDETDGFAADAAGVEFVRARDFFGWGEG